MRHIDKPKKQSEETPKARTTKADLKHDIYLREVEAIESSLPLCVRLIVEREIFPSEKAFVKELSRQSMKHSYTFAELIRLYLHYHYFLSASQKSAFYRALSKTNQTNNG